MRAAEGNLQSVLRPAGADAAIAGQFAQVLFGAGALVFAAAMASLALSLRHRAGAAFPVLALMALLALSTWRSAGLAPQGANGALAIR